MQIRKEWILVFLTLPGLLSSGQAGVKAWEGSIRIPTYEWKDDPYPQFWALGGKIVYPYTMQEVVSDTPVDKEYRALFLENEYLKVTCLPELGGRIFSVLNKVTGQEMFHRNNVVKPGLIGMRGAWISGGIEWNTGPHGHTVTAISPVNAVVQENPDGSATLHVTNTEQIFRTRWHVKLTLHPERSFLHEEIRIYNPTDGIHPYYFWNCTAFPCGKGTRFIFPMTLGCDHNGEKFFTWPVHEGKDISWLKNYDRPTSIFAWECDQDFFGCYDIDLDKGLVQVADHRVLKGKKAWTWGQSEDGLVSQSALTDEDGPYIEVQSGPLRTQADYGELLPHESVEWEEWWYPVYGFQQGFDYATRDVVIEVVPDASPSCILHLLSTREFPGCQVTFAPEGGTEQTVTVDLTPREAQKVVFENATKPHGRITVTDPSGEKLAEFEYPLPLEPLSPPAPAEKKPEEEKSPEELFRLALEEDRATSRKRARELYEEVIEKASDHAEAYYRLAVLDLEAGLHREARENLEKALSLQPDHAMAHYFLGVVDFRSGNFSDVLKRANRIVELQPASSLGYDLKGRAAMGLGRRQQAVPLFEKAAKTNPHDTRAWEHLAMAFFGSGQNTDAFAVAKDLQDEDPTALVPRAILACENPTLPREMYDSSFQFLGEVAFEYVESQLVFEELGMPRVAFLFSTPLMVEKYRNTGHLSPIQFFYSATLALSGGAAGTAKSILDRLGDWNPRYVFPSRTEAVSVLGIVKNAMPGDGRISLLRGNALANLGRLEEAVGEWETAIERNPNLDQAHRNLGLYYWKEKEEPARAAAFYRRAIALKPEEPTLYVELSEILKATPEEVVALLAEPGRANLGRNELSENLARAYNALGEYSKTIDLLDRARFNNWESRTTSRNLWVEALVARGKTSFESGDFENALTDFRRALTYPPNLGVGKPAEPIEAEIWYWVGKTLLQMEKPEEAKAAFRSGMKGDWGGETEEGFREQCRQELEKIQ